MTRIVYLSRNDGTDTRIGKECASLAAAGAEVTLVGWDWGQSGGQPTRVPEGVGLELYRSPAGCRGSVHLIGYAWFVAKLVRRVRPHAVHAVNEELVLLASLLRSAGTDFRLVGDLFDSLVLRAGTSWRGRLLAIMGRWAQGRADALIVTDRVRHQLLPATSRPRALIVPNYPLDPGPELVEEQPPADGPCVFVGGSLSDGRGLHTVLAAVRRLPGASIVAAGWLYDETARRFVEAGEVDYRGVVSPEDALQLAARCHAVLAHYAPTNANNRLASPNKVYDALAVGRPVLINSEVQLSDWVADSDLGAVSPYGDVDALVTAIARLCESTSWERQRAPLRERFETGYIWSAAHGPLLQAHGLPVDAESAPAIAFVTTLFGGSGVGGHTFVEHLRRAHQDGDLDIFFVTTATTEDPAATVVRSPWPARAMPGKFLTLSLPLRRALTRSARPPSVIWFNNAILAAATCLRPPTQLREVPLIGMINDYENADARWSSRRPVQRKLWRMVELFCARRLDLVVVNSEWMASHIADAYRLDPDRIAVLYKAVARAEQRSCRLEPGDHRQMCRTAEPRIGYLKADAASGRLADLITAVSLMPDRVTVEAAGPDGAAIEPYRNLARQLGVDDRVRFVGRLERDGVWPFLAQLDLFVNPARYEALGVSLLEAMEVGTPVLARRVGGIPEVVDKGRAGALFDGGPNELAMAIREVLDDEAGRRRRSDHARRHVESFRPEQMIWKIGELSRQAISRSIGASC